MAKLKIFIFRNIQKSLKKFNEAIISFQEAIKLHPNFSEAYNNLGNIFKSLNENKQAIDNYKKAISLKENNFRLLI